MIRQPTSGGRRLWTLVALCCTALTFRTASGQAPTLAKDALDTKPAASRPHSGASDAEAQATEPELRKVDQLRREIDELRTRMAARPFRPRAHYEGPPLDSRPTALESAAERAALRDRPRDVTVTRLKLEGRARFANVEEFPTLPGKPIARPGLRPEVADRPPAAPSAAHETIGIPERNAAPRDAQLVQGMPLPAPRTAPAPLQKKTPTQLPPQPRR